jgi:alpha-mannosidase
MQVSSAEPTELFTGPPDAPLQLARVTVSGCTEPTLVRVDGDGLAGETLARIGQEVVEVPVAVEHPVVGQQRAARVDVAGGVTPFAFTVAEPG